MAGVFDRFFGVSSRQTVAPTQTAGVMGTSVIGGYVETNEKNSDLAGVKKFETYSEILANTSIAAAGIRYFLNLAAKADWTFEPSEDDKSGEWAEFAEQAITEDPTTSWARIVRRAAMYRFHGFSTQEWTAFRREDGKIAMADVAPRAQKTIEQWDVEEQGKVNGVVQRAPATGQTIYLPRAKLLYMVDDTLSDSPEGLGLIRHLVKPAEALKQYERLEGLGIETDLRGVPVGKAPFAELDKQVENQEITAAQRAALIAPIKKFVKNHVRNEKLGLVLDSMAYTSDDDAQRPSGVGKYSVDLITGGQTALAETAAAIERLNREIARILGVEQLLLGATSTGSFALADNKTQAFFLIVESTLNEVAEAVRDDLLGPLWALNGLDPKLMPTPKVEAVKFSDVEAITASLREMATAGAPIQIDDPATQEVYGMLGLTPPERLDDGMDEEDAAIAGGKPEDEDDLESVEDERANESTGAEVKDPKDDEKDKK
jgi:hypothetical protein